MTSSLRDERIDFLRGWALLVMAVDHVQVKASLFYPFTGQGKFYISAAEGFFFLSGLVLGMVARRLPLQRMIPRLLRRAGQLYLVGVGISLAFTLLGLAGARLWYNLHTEIPRGAELAPFIARMFTLQNAFHGAEFMVLYVIFLLAAVPVVWACASGKSWLVVLVSLAVYAYGQSSPQAGYIGLDTIFAPLNWQPLFFGGLLVGYHREGLAGFYQRLRGRLWLEGSMLLAALFFLWLHLTDFALLPGVRTLLGERESQMAPLRLALVGLYLGVFFLLTSRFWSYLRRWLGWLFLPMGRNSLLAFVTHLAGIVLIYNLPFFTRQPRLLLGTGLHLLILALVCGVVKSKEAWAKRARRNTLRDEHAQA